ncbi:MAG: bi-domain-containing oxidoreductase [Deltaproteobacteria bacterium]|nr:bi-domain-containing oxidoreductase [Deltaproteobacteria bacterium]
MKQILQNLKTGVTEIADVPVPAVGRGMVLIKTGRSLISAGTERMLVDFSQGSLLQKARSQPDKVKQVLDKMRTDGLVPTVEAVFRKLDEPMPLGYCNAGRVIAVGAGVYDLSPGDRVASNGFHAEVVTVPRNLVVRIPENVSDEAAAFTVLGAIALQGIRLAQPTLGERFMVFGMGLLGLLTIQLLRAQGCEVMAVDMNAGRLALAEKFGAHIVDLSSGADPIAAGHAWTGGAGVDGVLITASTKTDELMHQAAEVCRKRGRIVLVGVVGLNLRRDDFYKKELSFQVSCSYGPGRYDESYEEKGQDYPLAYVRWTEGRNFEAVLGAMAKGALDVESLITDRFSLNDAPAAYDKVQHDPNALGVLLEYPELVDQDRRIYLKPPAGSPLRQGEVAAGAAQAHVHGRGKAVAGVIGVGNFAVSTMLPALIKTGARIKYLAGNRNGAAVAHAARKFKAEQAVTDSRLVLNDTEVNTVFVVTGHNTHARFVCEALAAGKHVFVEKPLCINESELQEIINTYSPLLTPHSSLSPPPSPPSLLTPDSSLLPSLPSPPLLMVGFNRRFSPHIVQMKKLLAGRSEPLAMTMTVNAGAIPPEHWIQNPEVGGGRIIGEGCHFIDLLAYLADSPVVRVSAMMVGLGAAVREDKMSILLGFADGSVGTVNYFANGAKSYPKEALEVFSDGRVLRMDNFRQTRGFGFGGFRKLRTLRQDKGHAAEIARFISCVEQGGTPLIAFDEIINTTRASFAAVASAQSGTVITL